MDLNKKTRGMKKLIIAIVIACACGTTNAQIQNVVLSKDSTLVAENIYAGILSWPAFNTENFDAEEKNVSIHLAAQVSWEPKEWFELEGMGAYQFGTVKPFGLADFEMKITPIHWAFIKVGDMATPTTEERPLPATAGGHFETWTTARLPEGAPCAIIGVNTDDGGISEVGIASREGKAEYHLRETFNFTGFTCSFACYYAVHDKSSGAAFTLNSKTIYNTLVVNTDVVANITNVNLFRNVDGTRKITLYSDMGYDRNTKELVRGEWGVLRNFSSTYAKGLIGIGYQYETRTINGYMFIHI